MKTSLVESILNFFFFFKKKKRNFEAINLNKKMKNYLKNLKYI